MASLRVSSSAAKASSKQQAPVAARMPVVARLSRSVAATSKPVDVKGVAGARIARSSAGAVVCR
jgi:hypothetical protein